MKNALKIVLASALLTAGASRAAPALAEPVVAVRVIRTGDLDLSTEAGRRQLDVRVAQAAREVCGVASDADLRGGNAVRQCRKQVTANAAGGVAKIIAARATMAVTATAPMV